MPVDIEATVIRNTRLSPDYNVIALAAPEIASIAKPGQFVMVKVGRGGDPLLRRPFSLFEVLRDPQGGAIGLSLLSKRVGITTDMLYALVEGDIVSCLGPLGRPFQPIDSPAQAWMVAGGVGLAPFALLTESLRARGTESILFYGARSRRELFYLEWFEARDVRLVLSTEDGSCGNHGRITAPLERELQRARHTDLTIFACGPEPMLEAVTSLSVRYGCPSQVSVERTMGCGMGGCYSCVIPVRDPRGGHHYVRSCIAGPVFSGSEIAWE
jgi:dihydroorotate dehydrogenase electron transfer subunit